MTSVALQPARRARPAALIFYGMIVLGACLLLGAMPAFAGQASSGELAFYPCTACHPVMNGVASAALPNDFEGHRIVLEKHDVLGEGGDACLVCHDDPARDPGKLRVLGGGFADVGGDVSGLCATCHSGIYNEWSEGMHGRNEPTCTSAGCHDPHTPSWIHGDPLPPFVNTGFTVRAVSDRIPFTPLAAYPVKPPVKTPAWLRLVALVGAVVSAGLVVLTVRGRLAR